MWPFSKLTEKGVMGMNRRSIDFIFEENPRDKFHMVDNKIITKDFMHKNEIPTTETFGIIHRQSEIAKLAEIAKKQQSFVLKPANGSGGDGITIIVEHDNENFTTAGGNIIPFAEIKYRLENIITGMHSSNGQNDSAIIEYKINQHSEIQRISYKGIADIRIIIHNGNLAMAMLRVPTKSSDGKANLHQGGVGVGIDVETGITTSGSLKRKFISKHPDNDENLIGLKIPHWKECKEIALKFQALCGLGYVGVDIAMDEDLGPLVLEGNARPGLEIQLANREGLLNMLKS